MRGCSFTSFSPVVSAENNFCSPPPIVGMMAMVKNTMPTPPIHCVSTRQKLMEWGSVSSDAITVAPVVVKPENDSKHAWANRSVVPLSKNGSVPNSENTIHTRLTT